MKLTQLIKEIGDSTTKTKVTYTKPNFDTEWEEAKRYEDVKKLGKEKWIELAKRGTTKRYSTVRDKLTNTDAGTGEDYRTVLNKEKVKRFDAALEQGKVETPIAVRTSNGYDLLAGNTRLTGLVSLGYDPPIWVVDARAR